MKINQLKDKHNTIYILEKKRNELDTDESLIYVSYYW